MLEEQIDGKIDAWCIRWYLSLFMLQGLTLYPTQSLVGNLGLDGSGTHCGKITGLDLITCNQKIKLFPKLSIEDTIATETLSKYFRSINSRKTFSVAKTFDKVKHLLRFN
jgi:hypothetical protein